MTLVAGVRWAPGKASPNRLPRGAQRRSPDEAQVHSEGAVRARAVDAEEHPIGDAGPAGILGAAVEAHLCVWGQLCFITGSLLGKSLPGLTPGSAPDGARGPHRVPDIELRSTVCEVCATHPLRPFCSEIPYCFGFSPAGNPSRQGVPWWLAGPREAKVPRRPVGPIPGNSQGPDEGRRQETCWRLLHLPLLTAAPLG